MRCRRYGIEKNVVLFGIAAKSKKMARRHWQFRVFRVWLEIVWEKNNLSSVARAPHVEVEKYPLS
jgi:hypothetical protein